MTDVCLILEGTYPYITGGVSSWVHSLISGLAELDFSLIHLGAKGESEQEVQFQLPPNLRRMDNVEIEVYRLPYEIAHSLKGRAALPQARIYHALATGFAGLLGCQIREETGRPLILTEHGIYWNEIEQGANELECGFKIIRGDEEGINLVALRQHWTATFKQLARLVYQAADEIVTICRANQRLQLANGAEKSKCRIIPNGVDRKVFSGRHRPSAARSHTGIGFVGRVVPIKDVETFIRACRLVAAEYPASHFYVIGPTAHDEDYYRKCLRLVERYALSERLTFTGALDPQECYRTLDVVVLTSLSEGQPLVALEAMSAGLPLVVTDVGGCPELIEGGSEEDAALGAAGLVTPPQDAEATAQAILTICRDKALARQMGQTGRERVRRFYGQERCLEGYRRLYSRYL